MQDRFKYRVFVKNYCYVENGEYKYKPLMCNVHSLHLGTNKVIISYKYGNKSVILNENNILMQCTGKKDGHNKTIFEGDLLLCFDKPDRDGWYCELLCEVIYDNQNASFSLKTIKYKPFGQGCFTSDGTTRIYNFSDVENIEVFGNKYENPELLNKGIQ